MSDSITDAPSLGCLSQHLWPPDLRDPLNRLIALAVREVERDPRYRQYSAFDPWLNHSRTLGSLDDGPPMHRLYHWHYKTILDVAARVYERTMSAQGAPNARVTV